MTEYNPFQQEIADAVCADFYDKFKDDDLWEETAIEIVKKADNSSSFAPGERYLFSGRVAAIVNYLKHKHDNSDQVTAESWRIARWSYGHNSSTIFAEFAIALADADMPDQVGEFIKDSPLIVEEHQGAVFMAIAESYARAQNSEQTMLALINARLSSIGGLRGASQWRLADIIDAFTAEDISESEINTIEDLDDAIANLKHFELLSGLALLRRGIKLAELRLDTDDKKSHLPETLDRIVEQYTAAYIAKVYGRVVTHN